MEGANMATIQVRTNKHGEVSYAAKIRIKGHPHAYATFERKTDANKWVQETESTIRQGKYFKTAEARKHSFGEMIDRYIKEVLPGKSTSLKHTANQKVQLLWWKEKLGAYMLSDITRPRIVEQRDKLLSDNTKRKEKRSGATVVIPPFLVEVLSRG
jgi:hypothetical protein